MLICVQTVNRQKPDWNIIKRPVCRPHRYTSRLKSIMWITSRTEILEWRWLYMLRVTNGREEMTVTLIRIRPTRYLICLVLLHCKIITVWGQIAVLVSIWKSITILIWPAQVWVDMGISMSSALPKSCWFMPKPLSNYKARNWHKHRLITPSTGLEIVWICIVWTLTNLAHGGWISKPNWEENAALSWQVKEQDTPMWCAGVKANFALDVPSPVPAWKFVWMIWAPTRIPIPE